MKRCVQCGNEKLEKATTSYSVRITPEITAQVDIPALQCTKCNESYTTDADMAKAELMVAPVVARSGQVNGETFRFLRRALGKQGKELAEQLGVAPETISRWERGGLETPQFAWLTLAMLVLDKAKSRDDTQQMLRAIRHPTTLPRQIKVA